MEKFILKILLFFYLFLPVICVAQEQITITTYYPSPYGSYNSLDVNNLQADRIAIGNGNNPTAIDNGVLDFIGLTANPTGNAGSLYYNSTSNVFFYYNGTSWQPLLSYAQLVYYSNAAGDTDCVPTGTHVVGVLTTPDRRGANMKDPPENGYIICH